MKKISKIFGLGILSLAALSCTKVSPLGPGQPDSPTISIAADVPATKGFLDGSFPTGSQIVVYDWLQTGEYHMRDVGVKYNGGNNKNWSYMDPSAQYYWVDGTHNFFGWMTDEGTGADSDPTSYSSLWSFNSTTKILKVDYTFTPSTHIYDFVYSDIVSVPYEKGETSTPDMVMLNMKHLFTAISFGAINNTKSNIVIEEFSINDLYSKNSASINYNNSNNGVVVASYEAGVKQTGAYRTATNVSLDGRSGAVSYNNVFTSSNNQEYMIMWPHETSKLHSNEEPETNTENGEVTYPDSYLMYIKYTMDGTEYEKRINFPEGTAWEPGKRYHYDIEFADKTIKLICTVNPWKYNDFDIDYSTESVSMMASGALSWSNTASNVSGSNVYIKNNQPAEGSFHFRTPVGGNWIATLSGDVDAFYIEPATGPINDIASQIRVVPIHTGDRERDYKVTVEFFVRRSDGRIISADSQIQPTRFTIIHQKNK